jgi:hypothetical protein
MSRVQDQVPARTPEEADWLQNNVAEQEVRHAQIVADMESIAAEREAWVNGFLERIQTRGFNYNCDALRVIDADELPQQPARPFKVVY